MAFGSRIPNIPIRLCRGTTSVLKELEKTRKSKRENKCFTLAVQVNQKPCTNPPPQKI